MQTRGDSGVTCDRESPSLGFCLGGGSYLGLCQGSVVPALVDPILRRDVALVLMQLHINVGSCLHSILLISPFNLQERRPTSWVRCWARCTTYAWWRAGRRHVPCGWRWGWRCSTRWAENAKKGFALLKDCALHRVRGRGELSRGGSRAGADCARCRVVSRGCSLACRCMHAGVYACGWRCLTRWADKGARMMRRGKARRGDGSCLCPLQDGRKRF